MTDPEAFIRIQDALGEGDWHTALFELSKLPPKTRERLWRELLRAAYPGQGHEYSEWQPEVPP